MVIFRAVANDSQNQSPFMAASEDLYSLWDMMHCLVLSMVICFACWPSLLIALSLLLYSFCGRTNARCVPSVHSQVANCELKHGPKYRPWIIGQVQAWAGWFLIGHKLSANSQKTSFSMCRSCSWLLRTCLWRVPRSISSMVQIFSPDVA